MQGLRKVPLEKPFAYTLNPCHIAVSSKSIGCGNVVRVLLYFGIPQSERTLSVVNYYLLVISDVLHTVRKSNHAASQLCTPKYG